MKTTGGVYVPVSRRKKEALRQERTAAFEDTLGNRQVCKTQVTTQCGERRWRTGDGPDSTSLANYFKTNGHQPKLGGDL